MGVTGAEGDDEAEDGEDQLDRQPVAIRGDPFVSAHDTPPSHGCGAAINDDAVGRRADAPPRCGRERVSASEALYLAAGRLYDAAVPTAAGALARAPTTGVTIENVPV